MITGKAYVSIDDPPVDQVPAYLEKYREFFARFQITPQRLVEDLTVPLRIRPLALRYARNGT